MMVYLVAYQFVNRTTDEKKPFYEALEQFADCVEVTSSVCLVASDTHIDHVHDFLEDHMIAGDSLFVSRIMSIDDFYTADKKVIRWLRGHVHGKTF